MTVTRGALFEHSRLFEARNVLWKCGDVERLQRDLLPFSGAFRTEWPLARGS